MMKSIELTAVNLDTERNAQYASSNPPTDDLENPIPAIQQEEAIFFPITIFVDDVREFYPRKPSGGQPRVGTRIVYKNGAARPVKETYDEVKAKFASLFN